MWNMLVTFLISQLVKLLFVFCFYFRQETILPSVKLRSLLKAESKIVEEIKLQVLTLTQVFHLSTSVLVLRNIQTLVRH